MKVAFFGSSLLSAYWNGAATYYRGILRALHAIGYETTFYEPDAFGRQSHRDIALPEWARVVVYEASESSAMQAVETARAADLIVKASGVGVFDRLLDEAVLARKRQDQLVVFWDVDAPATLDRLHGDPRDPFAALIPRYDMIFTYGGGDPVISAYRALGAKECVAIYNALDTSTHYPVPSDPRFEGALAFLGNRLPDREARVDEFFFRPAKQCCGDRFVLGGAGWGDRTMPAAVRYVGHVYTGDHNAFNCTPVAVLNISRESMARYGFSPATRVFEAAGAGACIISDRWEGLEQFFEPGSEILVAGDGEDVAGYVRLLTRERAGEIGTAARRRVLAEHTYDRRAQQVHSTLTGIRS